MQQENNNFKSMIMVPQLDNKASIDLLQLPCEASASIQAHNERSLAISPPRPGIMASLRLPKVPEIVNIKSRSEGQHSPIHHQHDLYAQYNQQSHAHLQNLGVPQLNRTSSESSMSSLFSAPASK